MSRPGVAEREVATLVVALFDEKSVIKRAMAVYHEELSAP